MGILSHWPVDNRGIRSSKPPWLTFTNSTKKRTLKRTVQRTIQINIHWDGWVCCCINNEVIRRGLYILRLRIIVLGVLEQFHFGSETQHQNYFQCIPLQFQS